MILRVKATEFSTAEEAAFALTAIQGCPVDSKHTFGVNLFSDLRWTRSVYQFGGVEAVQKCVYSSDPQFKRFAQ